MIESDRRFLYASIILFEFYNREPYSYDLLLHNGKKAVNDCEVLEFAKTICGHLYLKRLICPYFALGSFFKQVNSLKRY